MIAWERRFAIVCAVAGVILLFLGASVLLVEQRVSASASYPLIAGVALLIAYGILDPTAIRDLVSSRQSRFGTLSVLVTAFVLGILVMGNVLAARSTQAIDLTRFKVNTLAPESLTVTRKLESELKVTIWDNSSDPGLTDLKNLLERYHAVNPSFKYAVADPNFDPATARAQGVVLLDTVVMQYKGKTQILTAGGQTEQDVTAAILKLESNRTPTVCWVTGDGERDLKNSDQVDGYTDAADQMVKDNFAVRDLLLSQAAAVPADCDVVALVGPTKAIPEAGIKTLGDYVGAGGRLLIAIDAWREVAVNNRYNSLLTPYGASFSNGLVVPDAAHAIKNEPTAVAVVKYGSSPIAKDLSSRIGIFPETTSIDLKTQPDVTGVVVASTSDQAYLVQEPRQDVLNRQSKDKAGVYTIMETLEKAPSGAKKTRIVLVGTSAFAENGTLQSTAVNIQLLTGSLNYLTEQESLISIPPKPSANPQLTLTQEQTNLLIFITMGLTPLLVITGGIAVWARRRLIA